MADITQAQIEEWIMTRATGVFHYTKVMDEQFLANKELYPTLRELMYRCKMKGIVASVDGRGDGWWRPVDKSIDELCWWNGDDEIGDNLILPLDLNKYCYIPLPSLIIIAGRYNAGKTAFCINLVNDNIEKWEGKLDFYVSEGAEMMRAKFDALNPMLSKPPPFKMYRRTEHFADVIDPDHLSVIDYLRVDMSKTYEIGNALFAIFNKLNRGIAVVAMQKPPGDRKIAFGGASTAFEPTLYIGMDKDTLGFEKIKVPKITEIDPYSVKITFRIARGVNFYEVHEEYG